MAMFDGVDASVIFDYVSSVVYEDREYIRVYAQTILFLGTSQGAQYCKSGTACYI